MDFIKVLELVESGVNVSKALKILGISRSKFYRDITDEQKRLLEEARLLVKRDNEFDDDYNDDDTDRCLYY